MKLKPFQREDLARLAIHEGGILAHDTGLGKGLAAFVWPILKVGALCQDGGSSLRLGHAPLVKPLRPAEPVLLVAAQDLHAQIVAEGQLHFGVTPTVIKSQQHYLDLLVPDTKIPRLPAGYFLTDYITLSRTGVRQLPGLTELPTEQMFDYLGLRWADVEEYFGSRGRIFEHQYSDLDVTDQASLALVTGMYQRLMRTASHFMQDAYTVAFNVVKHLAPANPSNPVELADLCADQREMVRKWTVAAEHTNWRQAIGHDKHTAYSLTDSSGHVSRFTFHAKCTLSPSLADLMQDSFAAVVYDEGTRLKGETTLMGMAARQMSPRFRLILTATPIKNRLPDVFRLIHWSTGAHPEATARCPFGDGDSETFAEEFSVTERNLSAEASAAEQERSTPRPKRTAQVCNIHRLWKLMGPIILRRRKADCGEQIVGKVRNVIRVPMGLQQAQVYRYHLEGEYKDKNGRPAVGAKLQALRIAAANPASHLLTRVPQHDSRFTDHASRFSYIPKVAAALTVIADVLHRHEQFVAFSAFHDSLDSLAARLAEAGVRHMVLDGRASPGRRGEAATRFKHGPPKFTHHVSRFTGHISPPRSNACEPRIPGLLAGVECMSEGHSFPLCNNVILLSYSWAMDRFVQAINRVYRLNSVADINIYAILCDGSIDRVLESNIQEKEDASELVLDGHLLGENPEEVSLAELLRVAEQDFAANQTAFSDEAKLTAQWPALRSRLAAAMTQWDRPIGLRPAQRIIQLPATPTVPTRPVRPDLQPARHSLGDGGFADLPLFKLAA